MWWLLLLTACGGAAIPEEPRERIDVDSDTDRPSELDPDPDTSADADTDTDTDATATATAYEQCFGHLGATEGPSPDYNQFQPRIGAHCRGTDHQDIAGIERVVFLGDSVTVGTPPTPTNSFYRVQLAEALAWEFPDLQKDWDFFLWSNLDVIGGTSGIRDSGDFASCAEWGARADDLMRDGDQLLDCFPESERHKTTLVIMTMGGNDLNSLTSGFMDGEPEAGLWDQTREFMGLMRGAVEWLKEPGRFPGGVHVIFTNLYEFTDGTGDVTSCPTAGLAGYDQAVTNPALAQMVVWSMEEYMSIAVDTQTDMLFLLESFCGHGYNRDDPTARCHNPGAPIWFDLTCIHPNPAGHTAIAQMFEAVIHE